MTNTESRIVVGLEELEPWGDTDAFEKDEQQITEADIRELTAYGFDSDNQTLVGLGPLERARRSRRAAEIPASQRMPQSEPPGPFIADDEMPRSQRGRTFGLRVLALPAALLVAVGVVALVHGRAPEAPLVSKQAVASDTQATAGLVVQLDGASPRILVDGEDRGTPPLELLGLQPGSHMVSIADPAYALYSQPVMLTADRVSTLEPVLTFVRGTLELSAGEGATEAGVEVEVVGADERRAIQHLPARLEVAPGEYRIQGTRKGYAPFESIAVLSGASPQVEVTVVLARKATPGTPPSATALFGPEAALAPGAGMANGANAGVGSLDITSSPPSNVVLDGRPLGKAPLVAQARPGTHTVMFIHPTHGRMSLSVNVNAGRTTSAAADF